MPTRTPVGPPRSCGWRAGLRPLVTPASGPAGAKGTGPSRVKRRVCSVGGGREGPRPPRREPPRFRPGPNMAEREVETGPRKRVGEVRPRAGSGLRAGGGGRGAAGRVQPRARGWRGGRRPEGGAARGSSLQVGQSSLAGGEGEGRGPWSARVPSLSLLGAVGAYSGSLGDARCQAPLLHPRGQRSPWKFLWGEVRWGQRWREEVVEGLPSEQSPGGFCGNTDRSQFIFLLTLPSPLTVIKIQSGHSTVHLGRSWAVS